MCNRCLREKRLNTQRATNVTKPDYKTADLTMPKATGKVFIEHKKRNPVREAKRCQELEESQVINTPVLRRSRHDFVPPLSFGMPQKADPILAAARQIIAAHNNSFAGFCQPLFINPLFSTDATLLRKAITDGTVATAMYAIGRNGDTWVVKAKLCQKQDSNEVRVQNQAVYIKLEQFLRMLPQIPLSLTGELGYKILNRWWSQNGQAFRIMDLPNELRVDILGHAVGYDIYPHTYAWNRVIIDQDGRTALSEAAGTLKQVPRPDVRPLTLNKKIHEELQFYVYDQMCKCFLVQFDYQRYIGRYFRARQHFGELRLLELDFTNETYMSFFKVRVKPFHDSTATPSIGGHLDSNVELHARATGLLHLPMLRHLFLRFRAPTVMWDPWWGVPNHRFPPPTTTFLPSCQKVVIDWIMTYAIGNLKHIPKVTLGGFIKNSTKAKWTQILEDEHNGICQDMSTSKGEIEALTLSELPPKCNCANRCGKRLSSTTIFDFEDGERPVPPPVMSASAIVASQPDIQAGPQPLTRPWNQVVRGGN